MLENSRTFSSISPENSCSSVSEEVEEHDPDTEPVMEIRDDSCNILESIHKSIVDELVDHAILDVCFEVHRAEKFNFVVAAESEKYIRYKKLQQQQQQQQQQQTKEQQTQLNVRCPLCSSIKGAEKFTQHLSTCMGIAKRKARQNNKNFFEESDSGADSDDQSSDSEDFKPGSSRKRNKKGNKNNRKPAKLLAGSFGPKQLPNANLNHQLMSHDEKRAFYDENCGVISKRTKRPCTKTLKCSQHTDEQRRDVRIDLLREDEGDQISNEEEIDVQSIDEDVKPFIMPSSFPDV